MITGLLPITALIGAGLLWKRAAPAGVDAPSLRNSLNALLVYMLVPALVFEVMLRAPLQSSLAWVVASAWATIALSAALAFAMNLFLTRMTDLSRATRGALILAATFGNGLGVALPVVRQLFDGRQDTVPLSFDLLATVPVSWTIGVYIAIHFGTGSGINPLRQILRLPPVWAVLTALPLNLCGFRLSPTVTAILHAFSQTAIPLMLLSLGLSLDFHRRMAWKWIALPVAIRLLGGLGAGLVLGYAMGFPHEERLALVWVCAAPSFMMGVVFCDRFGLDTGSFAMAMSLGVVSYLLAMPFLLSAIAT